MATQHFCQFLKQGAGHSPPPSVRRNSCVLCSTRLSRYNGEDACFSCQEKLRDGRLEADAKLAIAEEGEDIKAVSSYFVTKPSGEIATFYRECMGVCRGDGQTIFGEVDARTKTITLEKIKAVSSDGKCGNCGGAVQLRRDLVPQWAGNYRILPPR